MRAFAIPLLLVCLGAPPKVDPASALKSTYDESGLVRTYQHKDQPVESTGIDVKLRDQGGATLNTTLDFRLRGSKVINLSRCEVFVNGSKYNVEPDGIVKRDLKDGEATESFSAPAINGTYVLLHYLQSAKKATVRFHGDSGFVDHEVGADELRRIREVIAARTAVINGRYKKN